MVNPIGVDNTNANIRTCNSIKTRALAKNTSCIIELVMQQMLLQKYQDLNLKTIVLMFFIGLTNHQNESLKKCYEFCDLEYQKVIKYF